MSDEQWAEIVKLLLRHFDANEGTTYLYHDRTAFLEEVREEVPGADVGLVSRVLTEYHNK